jgi:hypothetical protein
MTYQQPQTIMKRGVFSQSDKRVFVCTFSRGTAISGIVCGVVFLMGALAAFFLCVCMCVKNGRGARVDVFNTSYINTVSQGYPGKTDLGSGPSCPYNLIHYDQKAKLILGQLSESIWFKVLLVTCTNTVKCLNPNPANFISISTIKYLNVIVFPFKWQKNKQN